MLYYIRDEDGSLIGFKYNNDTYYYLKNLQEDIIGITDSNYNKLCSYEYNAWGEILSFKDITNNFGTFYEENGLLKTYNWDIKYTQFVFHK